jgi:hypothetical protein
MRTEFLSAVLCIAAVGCGESNEQPAAERVAPHEPVVAPVVTEPPRDLTPDEKLRRALENNREEREAAIKQAIMRAGDMQLDGKAVLRPSASECLWKLNGEDPPAAFEAAKCIDRAETFVDLKTCTAPCRPPDPLSTN